MEVPEWVPRRGAAMTVNLCPLFGDAPMRGSDSKAGIFFLSVLYIPVPIFDTVISWNYFSRVNPLL